MKIKIFFLAQEGHQPEFFVCVDPVTGADMAWRIAHGRGVTPAELYLFQVGEVDLAAPQKYFGVAVPIAPALELILDRSIELPFLEKCDSTNMKWRFNFEKAPELASLLPMRYVMSWSEDSYAWVSQEKDMSRGVGATLEVGGDSGPEPTIEKP